MRLKEKNGGIFALKDVVIKSAAELEDYLENFLCLQRIPGALNIKSTDIVTGLKKIPYSEIFLEAKDANGCSKNIDFTRVTFSDSTAFLVIILKIQQYFR